MAKHSEDCNGWEQLKKWKLLDENVLDFTREHGDHYTIEMEYCMFCGIKLE